jgi:hypothetical protein
MANSDNKAFDMMTAVADKTEIDFSKQFGEYIKDESQIKRLHEKDLSKLSKAETRDTRSESNFEEFWKEVSTKKTFTNRVKRVGGDPNVLKERAHKVWSLLGKPKLSIHEARVGAMSTPSSGRWRGGSKQDFLPTYKQTEPLPKEPFSLESHLTQLDTSSLYDEYVRRHGEVVDQGLTYENSAIGRQDNIILKKQNAWMFDTLLEEFGHQMQGRKLGSEELKRFRAIHYRDEKDALARGYESEYSDPESLEYEAHSILSNIVRSAVYDEDEESLRKIKELDYDVMKTYGY